MPPPVRRSPGAGVHRRPLPALVGSAAGAGLPASALAARVEALEQYYVFLDGLLASLVAGPTADHVVVLVADPGRSATGGHGLLALTGLYGGRDMLERAVSLLPTFAEITQALADLRRLADALAGLPLSFDLADLRGYHYHSGVVFAAYADGNPGAVALGGRYDKVGQAYGRGRAATGFSMDLREVAQLAPTCRWNWSTARYTLSGLGKEVAALSA